MDQNEKFDVLSIDVYNNYEVCYRIKLVTHQWRVQESGIRKGGGAKI